MAPRRRHAWALLVGLLAAATLSAGPSGARRRSPPLRPPEPSPLDGMGRTLDLGTLSELLARMGYDHRQVNEAAGWVRVRVRGEHGLYSLYLVPDGDLLHVRVPHLLTVERGAAEAARLRARLNELNWLNLVGKYSWDSTDGEVRFAHAMIRPDGISFNELALGVTLVLRTVDQDMPALRSAAGRAAAAPSSRENGQP